MPLRGVILWIHALSGATWVAACGCFVIAGLALETGSDEQRSFVERVVPKINLLVAAAAGLLLATGVANFALLGAARGFQFSTQFGIVLGAKVVLFIGMVLALSAALRTAARPHAMPRLVGYHGAIAAMGGLALLLGLWLMGT
ncbi:MAG TPA: hypothetical protein VEJ86_08615 [Candidatus Binataceae bacterium]|nr:hypothetical protein [Candidatus Binataceae bacterium]